GHLARAERREREAGGVAGRRRRVAIRIGGRRGGRGGGRAGWRAGRRRAGGDDQDRRRVGQRQGDRRGQRARALVGEVEVVEHDQKRPPAGGVGQGAGQGEGDLGRSGRTAPVLEGGGRRCGAERL